MGSILTVDIFLSVDGWAERAFAAAKVAHASIWLAVLAKPVSELAAPTYGTESPFGCRPRFRGGHNEQFIADPDVGIRLGHERMAVPNDQGDDAGIG